MDRGASSEPLSWMVVPVSAILVASALTLPLQPYAGLTLSGETVMAVSPDSPGAAAGLRPGDRLIASNSSLNRVGGPLAGARPGRPLDLERVRGRESARIRLVPLELPPGERRMMVALLAVASGFVLLGGWVWSERRDRLTRPFSLLCLAFATLLTPLPRVSWLPGVAAHQVIYTIATLVLPALCVHFFALFPDPRARGGARAWLGAAYGIAILLTTAWVAVLAAGLLGLGVPEPALALLQGAAAIWFAAGLLCAVVLFARSYARAESEDARRRLRVVLAGTTLGLGPLAALIVLRNLWPNSSLPWERAAVVLTLVVPISFTWAIVVHRIFDFRVALRAAVAAASCVLAGAALYVTGELGTLLAPERGADYGSVALAALALGATLAGPSRPWFSLLGRGLLPLRESRSLPEIVIGNGAAGGALLEHACSTLSTGLRLDRCFALDLDPTELGNGTPPAEGAPWTDLAPALARSLAGREDPVDADDPALPEAIRAALQEAGIQWLVGIGEERPRAALLLGRRLAGAWLDRREQESLVRVARHLGVALENVALRRAARSHGALDRELEVAGAIQSHLLPRRAPVYPTLDCAAATLSSEPVGGDAYDFFERSPREFTLVVGDAAGKGVPAALLLARVQARFRDQASRTHEPGTLLHELNRDLADRRRPEDFVGLLCARVEVGRGRMHIANGGLMPPLVRRRSGRWEELSGGGLLLGVRPDSSYPPAQLDLRAGDVVLIHTDGLAESRRGEELFGAERIRGVIERNAHRRAADILDALLRAVREFAPPPLDDLTLVVMKQLADPPGTAVEFRSRRGMRSPMGIDETTEVVSPARAANPRAADPNG